MEKDFYSTDGFHAAADHVAQGISYDESSRHHKFRIFYLISSAEDDDGKIFQFLMRKISLLSLQIPAERWRQLNSWSDKTSN